MRALAVLTILLLTSLAGCLSGDDADAPAQDTDALRQGEWPSGESARDYIESYIMTHPFRFYPHVRMPATGDTIWASESPFMDSARNDLAALLDGFGLRVEREEYDSGMNIVAYQEGATHPEQWVVLTAHYDTVMAGVAGQVGGTVYGAWDDGAGTALLIELARTLSSWEFPFTIVYAFVDGEEKGLHGSRAFVEAHHGNGTGEEILANLNTDPPGLNWPCGDEVGPFAVKVIEDANDIANATRPRYAWLHGAINYAINATGVPSEALDTTSGIPIATVAGEGLRGGSDHESFDNQEIANVFLGGVPLTVVNGDPNENTAGALTYPLHSPLDTLEAMEARCTQGSLAGGLQTIADIMAHTLVALASTPTPLV